MADRKISDLTALTAPAAGDYLPIVDISEASAANKNKRITIEELLRGAPDGTAGAPSIGFESDPNTGIYRPGADQVAISTGGTARLFVDSTGNVGVGTTTFPYAASGRGLLTLNGTSNSLLGFSIADVAAGYVWANSDGVTVGSPASKNILFDVNGEKARIDSSGRLLVGTSTSLRSAGLIQIAGSSYPALDINSFGTTTNPELVLRQARGTSGTPTIVSSGDNLGNIYFQGYDSTQYLVAASIAGVVDGTPGTNDMPSRLVFSVTADGASSPTEAMRIKNTRVINFSNAPVYADNAAAKTGGLVDGDVYRTSTGDLKIVYT